MSLDGAQARRGRGRQAARCRLRVTKMVLKAVIGMMEKEFWMTTAGTGNDEKNALDDGDP